MSKLQIRGGSGEVPQLAPREPYFDGENLHVGKLDGSGNQQVGNYTHPETHPASMITETETLKVMTSDERNKLTALPTAAVDTDLYFTLSGVSRYVFVGDKALMVREGSCVLWDYRFNIKTEISYSVGIANLHGAALLSNGSIAIFASRSSGTHRDVLFILNSSYEVIYTSPAGLFVNPGTAYGYYSDILAEADRFIVSGDFQGGLKVFNNDGSEAANPFTFANFRGATSITSGGGHYYITGTVLDNSQYARRAYKVDAATYQSDDAFRDNVSTDTLEPRNIYWAWGNVYIVAANQLRKYDLSGIPVTGYAPKDLTMRKMLVTESWTYYLVTSESGERKVCEFYGDDTLKRVVYTFSSSIGLLEGDLAYKDGYLLVIKTSSSPFLISDVYGELSSIPLNVADKLAIKRIDELRKDTENPESFATGGNVGDIVIITDAGLAKLAAPTVASTLKHNGVAGTLPFWNAD